MKNRKTIVVLGCLLILFTFVGFKLTQKNNLDLPVAYLNENSFLKKELKEVFKKYQKIETKKVVATIISHHLLAKDLIAENFSKIEDKEIERVILVSPDHFKQIKKPECLVMTANVGWKTEAEIVRPESNKITELTNNKKNWCQNVDSFRGEHGVFALVPFIRNYLPKVKIIPLILRPSNNLDIFFDIGKDMAKEFNKNKTLVVVSSDFCHNISNDEAKNNDLTSIKILESKDNDKIDLINNDCPQCISFLFGYLGQEPKFEFVQNTNSYEISGEYPESVTSYISGYYQ